MAKYTIYIVTRREALRALGIRKSLLLSWERTTKIPRYPGRGGYTVPEFRRLLSCRKKQRRIDRGRHTP